MTERAEQIARAFLHRYEIVWNTKGAQGVDQLYTPDAMFAAGTTTAGRAEIAAFLEAIYAQGWTSVTLKLLAAREVGGVVLLVSEYYAFGSADHEGETLSGRSTHALTQIEGEWMSAMHVAL